VRVSFWNMLAGQPLAARNILFRQKVLSSML